VTLLRQIEVAIADGLFIFLSGTFAEFRRASDSSSNAALDIYANSSIIPNSS
jgi:hypothetical protein